MHKSDPVGIVSIPKKIKNKQIFTDRVRNDRDRNDRGLEMIVNPLDDTISPENMKSVCRFMFTSYLGWD